MIPTPKRWLRLTFGLLLGTMTYAIADDITLTTFYPSPRGVYKELHVTDRVGIGTTAPGVPLHLSNANTLGTRIQLDNTSAGGRSWTMLSSGSASTGGPGKFYINDSTLSLNRLAIDASGNVGIGTTSPLYRLDVVGVLRLQPSGAPPPADGVMYYDTGLNKFRCRQNGVWVDCAGNLPAGTAGQTLRHNGTAWVATSNLFNNGTNIGIGTTTPATALHVRTPSTTILSESTSPAGGAEVRMKEGGGGDWLVKAIQANGGFKIRDVAATQDRLTITNTGNVGIGTSTPTQKLHVIGNVEVSGSVHAVSDGRLKQHVMPLTQALARLDHIRGVAFEWNARAKPLGHVPGEPDIGVIAQEVAAVFPEAVSGGQGERYMAVDYGRLTAVLIEAVKELRSEQAALTRRIEELQQHLDDVTKQKIAPAQDQGRR